MFSDVISYLDEFIESLAKSATKLRRVRTIDFRLSDDFESCQRSGRYDDAILAADRAVELIDQHNHWDHAQAAKMLYLEYRVASAACRARIPLLSFLAVAPTYALSPDKQAKDAQLDLKPEPWAARCRQLVQLAKQELKLDDKCDIADATDEQFKWIMAERECVYLMAADGDSASEDSAIEKRLEAARKTFDVCLHELQRGEPVTDDKRLLLVGELGWDLAWAATGRSGGEGHREVLEQSEILLTKLRNHSRSLEKQLITTDWQQGKHHCPQGAPS